MCDLEILGLSLSVLESNGRAAGMIYEFAIRRPKHERELKKKQIGCEEHSNGYGTIISGQISHSDVEVF